MKQRAASRGMIILAVAFLGLSVVGCRNFLTRTTGAIEVNLSSSLREGARTIAPSFALEIDTMSVTVSSPGQSSQTQTTPSAGGTIAFTGLPVGSWSISVSALKGGALIGTGSATVAVSPGSTSSISVPITFLGFTSGAGTLAIPLSWPRPTGVDYLEWSIDGGASSSATVAVGLDYCTTTLSASLVSGAHNLHLSFKAGGPSGAAAGSFVEAVNIWNGLTSGSWIDGAGNLQSAMSFAATDFLDSNANLGGLLIQNGSTSGAAIDIGFSSSSSTPYDLYALPSTRSIVFTPILSVAGQYLTYRWNAGAVTEIAPGSASPVLNFSNASYTNMLEITVRAPNRDSTKTYAITWHGASVTVGVSLPNPSYQALTFLSASMVALRGAGFSATCTNPTLSSAPTGWAWYQDGVVAAGQTSPTFSLDAAAIGAMLGDYMITGAVTYNGVSYSGGFRLSVQRSIPLTSGNLVAALSDLNGNFVLAEDIVVPGAWTPVGTAATPFTGNFEGNGHALTINIPTAPSMYQGLFGVIAASATVKNLDVNITLSNANPLNGGIAGENFGTLENCSVSGTVAAANDFAGGITGRNSGKISGCESSATVTGTSYVAGIAGYNLNPASTITHCYATGAVTGTGIDVGGITGYCAGGSISYCYAAGDISGNSSVGGLAAEVANGSISNCYARGDVHGTGTQIGGLVGLANTQCRITSCYATGAVTGAGSLGGLVGLNLGTINASYYDSQTAGRSDTGKGVPYTTAQMKTQANFSDWDFSSVWGIDAINNGYPYLRCFGAGTVSP